MHRRGKGKPPRTMRRMCTMCRLALSCPCEQTWGKMAAAHSCGGRERMCEALRNNAHADLGGRVQRCSWQLPTCGLTGAGAPLWKIQSWSLLNPYGLTPVWR